MRGWVYVCSNKAMPGLLKVGFTLKDPDLRAQELEQTGVPHPFVVEYEVMVTEPRNLEQRVHGRLAGVHERKEWFRCTLSHAIAVIRELTGGEVLLENIRNADFLCIESLPAPTVRPQPEAYSPSPKMREEVLSPQRLRFSTNYSGLCRYCRVRFTVTVTRHDVGSNCPECKRFNNLTDFIKKELPR